MHKVFSCIKKGLNINTKSLAQKLCVDDSTVRYWLNDRNPRKPSSELFDNLCEQIKNKLINADKVIIEAIMNNLEDILSEDEWLKLMQISPTNEEFIINSLRIRYDESIFKNNVKKIKSTGKIRAVIFDFDGTLTSKKDALSTWEKIWIELGYQQEDCEFFHKQFIEKKITHQEWCNITCEKFMNRGMTIKHLENVASKMNLMKNTKRLFAELDKQKIDLFIVSGSIDQVIKQVLKRKQAYVDGITANIMRFDELGNLQEIIGTKYDFIGKARFALEISAKRKIAPEDILFIGNSDNDIYVWKAGVKTLCVNPQFTNPYDSKVWNSCIKSCDDALEILKYINQINGVEEGTKNR